MKKRLVELVLLLTVAIGAEPLSAQLWKWTTTAAPNGTADPNINFAEGQSPSSVNDSARALMMGVARWRDDISGSLTTTGASTAYVFTSNQGLPNPPLDGQMIAITPNVTNDVGVTAAENGGSSFPIQSIPGVGIGAGTMIAGTPYTMKFSASASAWILRDFFGAAYAIPLGGFLMSTDTVPPNSNFVAPAGQCISRTVYSAYFARVGTKFGACDGTTTFAVIDMRGRAPYALDTMNGGAANRLTSNANGCGTAMTDVGTVCANGFESRTLLASQIPAHIHPNTLFDPGHPHGFIGTGSISFQGGGNGATVFGGTAYNNGVQANQTGITLTNAANTGGGNPYPSLGPAIGVMYFVRIL